MGLAFLEVAFLKFCLHDGAQSLHFLIDVDEKLTDAVDKSLEGGPHVLLKLQNYCWFLVRRPQERCLQYVIRNGYQLFVLPIEMVDLCKYVLMLRIFIDDI